jgi:diketogulonate reductase-like aldo/keto reductase
MFDNSIPSIKHHGTSMPRLGLGTMAHPEPGEAANLISYALTCGYRHIDTARKYGSEEWVGEGIKKSGIPRDDIWVTTKVTEDNAKADDFARSVEASLKAMQLDYVDLLLIHWPSRNIPLKETIGALAKAKKEGYALNIGVSNFTVNLMDQAVKLCSEKLFLNQFEYHAYIDQCKVIEACKKHDLLMTCYVPLGRGKILQDPILKEIGEIHGKSVAQVGLRWLIQQEGTIVIPGARAISRINENMNIFDFELSDEEMNMISNLQINNHRAVNPEIRRPVWD